jgi:predicted nucleic acid-binding protein
MGLILDSSIIISAERRGATVVELLKHVAAVGGDQRAAISAIGLTELAHGVYRARSASSQKIRKTFLFELLEVVGVCPYTKETALLAGRIDGEQRSRGVTIPLGDLLIAATALEVGYSVLTENVRHFHLVPGVVSVELRRIANGLLRFRATRKN